MRGDLLPDAVNLQANWPSPVASEVRQGFQDRSRGMKGSQESLTTVVVKSWPTPNCMDVITPTRDLTQMESKGHWGKNMNTGKLSEMVNYGPPVPASSSTDGSRQESSVATRDGNWTTPAATDTGRTTQYQQGGKALSMQAAAVQWATPIMGDSHLASTPEAAQKRIEEGKVTLSRQNPGKLNPRWVETLMGLPVGWTMPSCVSPVTIEPMSFDCSATELCRRQQNEPSEC